MNKIGFVRMIGSMDTGALERLLEVYTIAFNDINPTFDLYARIENIIFELSDRYANDNK